MRLILVGILVGGCSSAHKARIPNNPDPIIRGEATEEKARRALEMKLVKQMNFLEENSEKFRNEVLGAPMGKDTYYYKYYEEFPEDPADISITISSSDTLANPYEAEVKYRTVRYQTRYTKSKGRAASDNDFIRDEGIRKEKFEFDGETWRLRSSVFEVMKTSVYRDDQWTATRGRIRRVEEEKPEYFVDKVRTLFGLLD